MSKHVKELILGFFILSVLAIFSYFIMRSFLTSFWTLDKTIQASLIGAFVALFSILFTYLKERSRTIQEAHRERKIEVYSIFFDFLFDVMKKSKNDDTPIDLENDKQFQEGWMDMSKKMLFYGSPAVLSAFNDFKSNAENNQNDTKLILQKVGRILLAMRADIGLSNRGLDSINIHQIYVQENIEKMIFASSESSK